MDEDYDRIQCCFICRKRAVANAERRAEEMHALNKREAKIRIKSLELEVKIMEAKLANMTCTEMEINFDD